ncbi:Hypothetical predicted protein [Paramuricea clavata]|uniref:Uncharacterized protein n=1 Tax=Paramuricea clavata TaxID=317549 RepID=A0A7D9HHS4_PARCT|nr:Hypothetical predicted protein [Paramuricea clavata]
MIISLTGEKTQKIKEACQKLLQSPQPTIREVARVIGMLTASFPGVMFGPLHYRHLDMDKTVALKIRKGNYNKTMTLSDEAKHELSWWVSSIESAYNVVSHGQADTTMTTDASKTGWGCSLSGTPTGGSWDSGESEKHINWLEVKAILLSLKSFVDHICQKHVKILSDNTTAVCSHNNTDVTIPSSEDTSSTKEVAITDVPLIGGLLESQGISKEAASIIVQAWRPGTQKQYKYYLQKWEQHCCERSINPISPNVGTAIDFLHEFYKEGLSYSTLNTVRSALSSVVQPIDNFTFGNHPLVTRYIQGVFVNRPALPRYKQIWDVSVVIKYLKSLGENTQLSLQDLTMKTTMLLALVTGQRCQTIQVLNIKQMVNSDDIPRDPHKPADDVYRTVAAGLTTFTSTSPRAVWFPRKRAVAIANNKLFVENETGELVTTHLNSDEEILKAFHDHFPQFKQDTVRRALAEWNRVSR